MALTDTKSRKAARNSALVECREECSKASKRHFVSVDATSTLSQASGRPSLLRTGKGHESQSRDEGETHIAVMNVEERGSVALSARSGMQQ